MNNDEFNALYGPAASHSEHKAGDSVLVRDGTDVRAGIVLGVRAAGPAHQGGASHPMLYIVDMGTGFPVPVPPSRIIEGSFTAILGSYGYSYSMLDSREQAENLAVNVIGQIIDSEQGRLRVLTARIEGDERAGKIIAQCEAVGSEEGH